MPGPIPMRSDQRERRNKPEGGPIEKIEVYGNVTVPPLNIPDAHPFVTEIYEGMKKSAQKQYYEPTDWAKAKVTLHFLNKLMWTPNPSAMMVSSVDTMLASLLLTEGDRRRARIEIERRPPGAANKDGKVLQVADLFRQRFEQGDEADQ